MNASRDNNRVPVCLGTLNTDGLTPIAVRVNDANHSIKVVDATTGSVPTYPNASRDQNRVTTMWGVSSADGVTPIAIATDSDGNLLIDSN